MDSLATLRLFILSVAIIAVHAADDDYHYAALIDAGSSGSRMHVYRWSKQVDAHGVPQVEELSQKKMKPGLSSLADTPDLVSGHLQPLVQVARENVPESQHGVTPIYLMATAGVRLVPRLKRKALFDKVHAFFENATSSPFTYIRSNSRVLSGEEEGAFSWIAVNYNLGFFTNTSVSRSVGLLEMGGASAQVAFIPDGQILADKFPVKVGRKWYGLYVHSYLYYGQDYTEKRIQAHLHASNPTATTLDNPCMLKGDTKDASVSGKTITFRGSSDPIACNATISKLIWHVTDDRCHPSPCTIGNTYQPPVGGHVFYAIKAFVYSGQTLNALGANGELDLNQLSSAASSYCSMNLTQAVESGKPGKYASGYCMMGTYIPTLLHDGLGFPQTGGHVIATNSIHGKATDWPLGAVMYEAGKRCAVTSPAGLPRAQDVLDGGPSGGAALMTSHSLIVCLVAFVVCLLSFD